MMEYNLDKLRIYNSEWHWLEDQKLKFYDEIELPLDYKEVYKAVKESVDCYNNEVVKLNREATNANKDLIILQEGVVKKSREEIEKNFKDIDFSKLEYYWHNFDVQYPEKNKRVCELAVEKDWDEVEKQLMFYLKRY